MRDNPFVMSFGIEPTQYISRLTQKEEIIETFTSSIPANYAYMISGVRGSGKTVMLSDIANEFSKNDNWIVINVTPDTDILNSIAAKLYSRNELKKLFVEARLDLSAFGLGISLKNSDQIFDMETALERMLEEVNKKDKRVLITIDEVINNKDVKVFASTFQLLVRQKLPIFLIMTGLYENIYNLQNEKTLTFLYRAPKIQLEPLSINSIARSYATVFNINTDTALHLARLTKGYPFAYQVLGYLYWKHNVDEKKGKTMDELLPEYDDILENYVYEKIWFSLSEKEKEIIAVLSKNGEMKVADIREQLQMTSAEMSVYRDRLKKQGIIDVSKYGYLSLKLPRFGEIIKYWIDM